MTTEHLVDPDLLPGLALVPPLVLSTSSLPLIRASAIQAAAAGVALPPVGVVRSEHRIAGMDGAPDVRLIIYAGGDPSRRRPLLLHIHGGGYILGSPEMNDTRNASIALDLGCIVASVDYRLAPETPFPGGLNDCYAALLWLARNADRIGIDPDRIAVAGESAGGGLAAALGLMARDRKEVQIAFQMLVYPMLDRRTALKSGSNPFTGEYVWTRDSNSFGWAAYLGDLMTANAVPYLASPAEAPDLSGLPPTFISVGALDLFLDEDIRLAYGLLRAGIPTELHVYPGAFHGFDLDPGAAVAQAARHHQLTALARAFGITN